MSYPQTEFDLHYDHSAKARFNLDGVSHQIPLEDQLALSDTYHETTNASIGLKAKPRVIPTPVSWLQKTFASATEDVARKVASAWDNKYCQAPKDMGARGQMESVLKCISVSRRVPEFAENWFESRFGMSFKEVSKVIGLS